MSFFGVELNSQVNRLILEIRLKLAQNKMYPNLRTISNSLRKVDTQGKGLISPHFFEKALNENGLFFKKFQIQAFQKAFLNQVGLINWYSFINHLKEPMGPLRRQIVSNIFDQLSNNKNQIPSEVLQTKFNNNVYDDFQKVIKKQPQAFSYFVNLIKLQNKSISRQQFIAYYDDLNINFQEDQAFNKFVSKQWNCKPKKTQKFSEQQLKSAIKALRFKLIQKTDGTKDEFLMKKIFNEFDKNKNQSIGSFQLDLMLKKLELPLATNLIQPLLQQLDKNKSGSIQYEQFKKFIFFDPFPK